MYLRPFVCSWACWSEYEVCSGALLVRCYFEATEIDHAIDQLKPGLKAMPQYLLFLLFKVRVNNMHLYAGLKGT